MGPRRPYEPRGQLAIGMLCLGGMIPGRPSEATEPRPSTDTGFLHHTLAVHAPSNAFWQFFHQLQQRYGNLYEALDAQHSLPSLWVDAEVVGELATLDLQGQRFLRPLPHDTKIPPEQVTRHVNQRYASGFSQLYRSYLRQLWRETAHNLRTSADRLLRSQRQALHGRGIEAQFVRPTGRSADAIAHALKFNHGTMRRRDRSP